MQEPRPVFFRRFAAWLIDSLVLGVLTSFFVWMTLPPSYNPDDLAKWTGNHSVVNDFRALFAEAAFNDQEKKAIAEAVRLTIRDESKKSFDSSWSFGGLPQVHWEQWQKSFLGHLQEQSLSLESAKKIQLFYQRVTTQLASLTSEKLAAEALKLFWVFFFVPIVVLLGYFFLEGIFGASLGKFMTGCRIGTRLGSRGNLLVWLPRFLLKVLPILLVLLGVSSQNLVVILLAAGLHLLYVVSYFSLLGSKKQPLYDKIAGTSVFRKVDLEE